MSEAEGALARALAAADDDGYLSVTSFMGATEAAAAILAALSADGWRLEREGLREAAQTALTFLDERGDADDATVAEFFGIESLAEQLRAALGGPDATD